MARKKILLIDDDINWRTTMSSILEMQMFQVASTDNGERGIELAREEKPDLILLDNKMPNMTGQEVAHILKNDPATKDIPIIMVTGTSMSESLIKFIKMELDDFLRKPFTIEILLQKIEKLIGRSSDTVSIDTQIIPGVLIALINTDIRYILAKNFKEGITIHDAAGAEEILNLIKTEKIRLIIANYQSAGLGSAIGQKLLVYALAAGITIILDITDNLPKEAAMKIKKAGKRFCLLSNMETDDITKDVKRIMGITSLF